jgi:hypothetical protein
MHVNFGNLIPRRWKKVENPKGSGKIEYVHNEKT